jgi:hypothetical protein
MTQLRKRGYIHQATPTPPEQPINNYIIRGSHRGPFEISVPRQSVSLYSYHHHHHHHHHHHYYNLSKVCTMTRLCELTECLSFRSTFPAQVLSRFVFRKCYALTHSKEWTPSWKAISQLVIKFPTFNVTRRFAAKPPASTKSQLIPVHILALLFVSVLSSHSSVIFHVYTSLYNSHPFRVCYIPCPSLTLWRIGGNGWRN